MQESPASSPDRGLRFAELACARLLHDLSGIVGTLSNTIELLSLEGSPSEAAELAGDATAVLDKRLRLLRAAWAGDGEPRDATALAELAASMPAAPRVRADLSGLAPGNLPPRVSRLALCLLLAGADALPGGGTVALTGDAQELTATLQAARGAWPESLDQPLDQSVPPPDNSRHLAGAMLILAADLAGMRLRRNGMVLVAGRAVSGGDR